MTERRDQSINTEKEWEHKARGTDGLRVKKGKTHAKTYGGRTVNVVQSKQPEPPEESEAEFCAIPVKEEEFDYDSVQIGEEIQDAEDLLHGNCEYQGAAGQLPMEFESIQVKEELEEETGLIC